MQYLKTYEKNGIYIKGIIYYLLLNFGGAIIAGIILATMSYVFNDDLLDMKYLMFAQLIISIITFIFFMIIYFRFLAYKLYKFRFDLLRNFIVIVIGIVLYIAFNFLFGLFITPDNSGNPANQEMLESILEFKNGYIYLIIMAVICAPLIEEIIFRQGVFVFLKKFPDIVTIFISAFVFGAIHVTTEYSYGVGGSNLLLTLLPYFTFGLILGIVYKFSDKNVISTIILHAIFNLIAVILI